jgi:outer membrane murein-binding lipoprotein Lpp
VSTAPVPEPVSEQGNKKKLPIDRNGPLRQHYTLKEMTVLVDQVLKIEPEHMKNGWKVVAAAVQKEMGTKQQRSPHALRKKYEEISFLTCDHADLGTLVKKIRDREAADIKKKHILTSVVGRPGNIHTVMGNDEEEENGAGIDESKSNEDDSTPMLRRVKNTQRLRAIETNRKEREKNKEALSVLVAQSAAALAAASSSSGQGINENVAELKIEQKHLKRKVEQIENKVADLNTHVAELNTNVEGMRQEFSHGVSRIEQLITKNMRRN